MRRGTALIKSIQLVHLYEQEHPDVHVAPPKPRTRKSAGGGAAAGGKKGKKRRGSSSNADADDVAAAAQVDDVEMAYDE